MKKLSLYLVVLSLLTALLPATMASASAPWFDIEAESGTLTHPIGKITDSYAASASGEQYVASTLYNCAGNSTLMSFSCDEEKEYDIWAVVGVFNGDYLGKYQFTLDETDVIYEKNLISAYNDAVGDSIYTSIDLSGAGHRTEMKWVKIASSKTISTGDHTLLAAAVAAGTGNKAGAFDVVRFVPSDWEWAPTGANFDAPEDMSTPAGDDDDDTPVGYVHAEAEDAEFAEGTYTVSNRESASNGKALIPVDGITSAETALEFNVTIPETQQYDVYALVAQKDFSSSAWRFLIDGTNYNQEMSEGAGEIYKIIINLGYPRSMQWVKIAGDVDLAQGSTTIVANIPALTHASSGSWLTAIDAIRLVPSSWDWVADNTLDAPEDMSTPGGGENEGDEISEWFDIEVEDGEYDGTLLTSNADGRDSFYTVQGTVSANKTTSSFTLDEEKTYDVWAVVGTHSNGHNLCNYTFSLDDTVLGTISAGVPTYNADAALYTGKMVAGGHSVTMVWAKVKDDVTIDADTHSLVAEISACVNGNKLGQIDVVRFVPSDWEWIPEANFDDPEDMSTPGGGGETPSPEPGEAVTSETGIFWMESTAAEFNSNVWRTVTNANASGGTLLDAGNENADDIEDYEIVYSFETEEEMVCDVWALVHDMAAHNSSYTFTLDDIGLTSSGYGSGTYTSSSTVYGGYSHSMTWQKVADTRIIEAGEHTFVVAPKKSSLFANRILAAVDCVVVIPTSLRWKPDVAGANVELPNASIGRLAAEYIKNNFFSGDYTRVADNIALPEIRTIAGAAITYECDNADVISADGVVSRPYFNAEDANVNYSICATINGVVTKVAVPMTVLKNSKYTVSEFEVSEEIAAGQAFTASADVNVNVSADSEITGKASLIIALYDTNGALEGIAMDGDVINSRTNTLEASLDMPENVAGKTVKVFLVNDLKMGNQLIDTVVVD